MQQIKKLANLAIFVILAIGFNGCILLCPILWPVNKKDVVGIYQFVLEDGTPSLPDGGSEILELNRDGTCMQKVVLKSGATFSTKATWEYGGPHKEVNIRGVYIARIGGEMNPNIGKTRNTLVTLPARRTFFGHVVLGDRLGTHYEKK